MGVYQEEAEWYEENQRSKTVSNSILSEADFLVSEERAKQYGSFEDNANKALDIYFALKDNLALTDSKDVALFMLCLKLGREACHPKRDNRVDIAGYLKLLDQLIEKEDQPDTV